LFMLFNPFTMNNSTKQLSDLTKRYNALALEYPEFASKLETALARERSIILERARTGRGSKKYASYNTLSV